MKSTTILLAAISLSLTSSAATIAIGKTVKAEGADITASMQAQNITEIEANQAIVVNYTVGTPESVKYTAPESLAPYLDITFKNGTLKCQYKDTLFRKVYCRVWFKHPLSVLQQAAELRIQGTGPRSKYVAK